MKTSDSTFDITHLHTYGSQNLERIRRQKFSPAFFLKGYLLAIQINISVSKGCAVECVVADKVPSWRLEPARQLAGRQLGKIRKNLIFSVECLRRTSENDVRNNFRDSLSTESIKESDDEFSAHRVILFFMYP